ncbi:protein-disulfide isomerase [Rhizomicrobium palustre]|jgi:protein-disulfide isomerase|uniref:Protein-disulfide isomerase n=1 Tax=Rhizomicrobium palustre TaxID=189966 RepID=A0A846N3T1_9PROT|nr:thioredoxin domain-containing protein [Rhizomicrobium palustre]NIK90169.1 protein-disulfide isomerase [Rhizomicrobium palustre]
MMAALAFLASASAALALEPVFPDDRSMGDPKAPVQVIEYAAPACPHCARFAATVMPDLKKTFIDTGKVHYVLRIFPISQIDGAVAGMAQCMPKTRYFEFLDLAFKRQDLWDPDGYQIPDIHAGLLELGKLAGLSEAQVDSCIADEKEYERVNRIAAHGEKTYGIKGVPTLIVNGSEVPPTERGWPQLKSRIETLLAGKKDGR